MVKFKPVKEIGFGTNQAIRYRTVDGQGYWIPVRKRVLLYWFKFLQEAQRSPDHKVNWRKYKGWGGPNVVLGQKFDDWLEERWIDLFSAPSQPELKNVRFKPVNNKMYFEPLRLRYLIWLYRDIEPDWTPRKSEGANPNRVQTQKKGSNKIAIARKVVSVELGKKKPRRETPLSSLQLSEIKYDEFGRPIEIGNAGNTEEQNLQRIVNRHLQRARKIIENVCEGEFSES